MHNSEGTNFSLLDLIRTYARIRTEMIDVLDEWVSINGDNTPPFYNKTRTDFGRELYTFTKKFLEENKNNLSHSDKVFILQAYIKLWREGRFLIDKKIPMQEDFNLEALRSFSNSSCGMFAGANKTTEINPVEQRGENRKEGPQI